MDKFMARPTGRRSLLRAGAGALGAAFWADETLASVPQNTKTNSKPSDLRITDLRTAVITGAPFRVTLLRIDANQGISGFGEVRDGASKAAPACLSCSIP